MFEDRQKAGEMLAQKLSSYAHQADTIVLGLPRGGVVVAHAIAKKLGLPLDVVVSRKIGMSGNPEAAIGAVTVDGQRVFDWSFISEVGIDLEYLERTVAEEIKEAQRRLTLYRAGRPPLVLKNKTVILVDDGVATGASMKAVVRSVQTQGAKKIVIAVPVAPQDFIKQVVVDQVVCIEMPSDFVAVGLYYKNFKQVEDDEVIALLK